MVEVSAATFSNWSGKMLRRLDVIVLVLISLAALKAADPPPATDVLLFADGERLTGHFVRSAGSSLTFKSDVLGEITVDWSKVKELQTSAKVAVLPKGIRLRRPGDAANIPEGTLSVQDQQVRLVSPPAETPRIVPLADAAIIIDQAGFHNAIEHQPGFFSAWKGTVTAGAAVVNATQNSESFTGAVSLVRAIPTVIWLEPRNRTMLESRRRIWRGDATGDAHHQDRDLSRRCRAR